MSILLQELIARRRSGEGARGIYSVCSAHPWVLRAAVRQALEDDSALLLEATSNQVNQFGGYTGMQPSAFRELVAAIAQEEGLPWDRVILGGDHLGPNPWKGQSATEAMRLAEEMVSGYAAAGFTKIHLDASMACADDSVALPDEVVAERAVRMCMSAERSYTGVPPVYVIGTEVPTPGGARESLRELQVTSRHAAERTLAVHREIFRKHGMEAVWPRVLALVVQPGVEFNHDSVVNYVPSKAEELTKVLEEERGLVFEAHSTDYQAPSRYQDLVRDGFAILKVGPALTFAMREALFALAAIEAELVTPQQQSHLPAVIEDAMLQHPEEWKGHYHGTREEQRVLRRYSYSDRMRYYWGRPEVQRACERLVANLETLTLPETMLSAFLPVQYQAVRAGTLSKAPLELILHAIRQALAPYAAACFPMQGPPSSVA